MNQADLPVGAPTVPQPRRLAISIDPHPGESLIGMVARATRLNVLGRTSVILQECGLRLLHPGTIGQDIQDCGRLAMQLGCAVSEVEDRRHRYLADPAGRAEVNWGSGALIRSDIVVEQRRISPSSIKVSDHHRAAWMNRLLPYCPESLESLIDTCFECGSKQGWRRGWGIGFCDNRQCRAMLRHPTGERAPARLANGYRFFAGMVSPDPIERTAALSRLAPDLVALPPAVLVNLTLQLGATVRESPFKIQRTTVGKLPPATIAGIASSGAELLLEWPRNLRTGIVKELNRRPQSDPHSHRKLLEAVRRLAIARPTHPTQAAVVRKAVPEAFEHATVALASLVKPVIGANSVCRATNLSTNELRMIREAGLIRHEIVAERKRTQVRFDKADVLELARCQRNSVFASRLEQRFGIPRYASEQLVCLGVVQREEHPALAMIHPTLRLVEDSIGEFARDMEKRGRVGSDDTVIPLGTAIRVIGGRPKPWGAILQAMHEGSLPFWLHDKGKFVRRAHVRLHDILAFAKTEFDERRWPAFPFMRSYSQIDAAGILNLDALQIQPLIHSGKLLFEPNGVALMTPRQSVLRIAQRSIATAEIALRTGMRFNNVPRFMAGHPQIQRGEAGWARADFDKVFGSL